jgi:hypothetical protein
MSVLTEAIGEVLVGVDTQPGWTLLRFENRHTVALEAPQEPTLRDRFAMAALTGYIAQYGARTDGEKTAARTAYALADAMLAARVPKPEPTEGT